MNRQQHKGKPVHDKGLDIILFTARFFQDKLVIMDRTNNGKAIRGNDCPSIWPEHMQNVFMCINVGGANVIVYILKQKNVS